MRNNMNKRRLIVTAFLLSLSVNLPRLILLLTGNALHRAVVVDGLDFIVQVASGVVFAALVLYLNSYKDWSVRRKVTTYTLLYIACTVLFIQIHGRLLGTSEHGVSFRLGYYFRDFFLLTGSILISNFLKALFQKQVLLIRNQSLENERLKAELYALRQQLNPHFFFNALNSLSSLMREDVSKSQTFLTNFSTLVRFSLDFQKKDLVSLTEEVRLLEAYIYLLQIRHGDRLTFVFNNFQAIERKIPPMALQLLVENAVNHNEISSRRPLNVELTVDDEQRTITVQNNVNPKHISIQGLGVGLANLNARYLLLSQQTINISNGNGIFKVTVPILE